MFLEKAWYKKAKWLIILWPLGMLFQIFVFLRRRRQQVLSRPEFICVPIIVIGNITVGGTGKTPLLIALTKYLTKQGMKPGVVSRGYGGSGATYPMLIDEFTSPNLAGDEAVLIAKHCNCPVVIDPDRNSGVNQLLTSEKVDVVLSDDGLQHYKLYRDIEIAVLDGQRLLGNTFCLPAGPLREPVKRLETVDYIVINGREADASFKDAIDMEMEPMFLTNLATGEKRPFSGAPFNIGNTLQAVCGIGNPERFYNSLEKLPYPIKRFTFPDHYNFTLDDFKNMGMEEHQPVVMTEKDAIKCADFAKNNFWFLEATVNLPEEFLDNFTNRIKQTVNMKEQKGAGA